MLLIFLSLFSCGKIDENGFKKYVIKKGKHRSGWRYVTSTSNKFNIEVVFDKSAKYTTQDPINQYDVNKLWGVSDCGKHHHDNSIRFGWRWLNDSVEILWYRRLAGNFEFEKITSVNIDEVNKMHLSINQNSYELRVNGVIKTVPRPCSQDFKRYMLYPYFGGDETAPHRIEIKIKEL
tara:strand:- start:13694 stop:14227 length:534 start_codon:yes stop_codon:yes gene_type:complete